MATKAKPKKKEESFDRYARAIQNDIVALGAKMETGFKSIRADMDAGFKNVHRQIGEVRDDVKRLNEIMVSKADLSETVRRELDSAPFAKESDMKELRERITAAERKLGIAGPRRAT